MPASSFLCHAFPTAGGRLLLGVRPEAVNIFVAVDNKHKILLRLGKGGGGPDPEYC